MIYETYIQQMAQLLVLKGCTKRTIDGYCICMRRVLTHLNKPVDDITTDDLMNYLHHLISLKLEDSTINQNHSIIIFFFSQVLRKYLTIAPIPFMRRLKKLPEILTPDEIKSILNSSRNLKYKTIFMTIYSS